MVKLCIYLINKFYQASLRKFLFKKFKGSVFLLPGISFLGSSKAIRRRKSAPTERCWLWPLWDVHVPQWPSPERKVGHLLGMPMVLCSPVMVPHSFVLRFSALGWMAGKGLSSVWPTGSPGLPSYLSPATPGVGNIWCSGLSGSFLIWFHFF